MARKFLYVIAVLIVLFIAGRLALTFYPEPLTRLAFTPGGAFEAQPPVAPNAYADADRWISRPGKPEDPAQWLPAGFKAEATKAPVAVFFIQPTSYLKKAHWNAPLDDADANRIGTLVVRASASPFNAAEQVWAPRYRQATFGTFITDQPEAQQALDLAYGDVAAAFDHFIASIPANQPFIVAGHSQGGYHLKRLLADKVKGTPLAARLVAAYPIGWLVDQERDLPQLGFPACTAPEQTGCVISWLSYTDSGNAELMIKSYERFAGARPAGARPARYLCSNPLTGGVGGTTPASANLGTMVPDARLENGTVKARLVGARCSQDGILRIGEGPDMGPFVLPEGNYHVYDVPLYWANLRADVIRRTAAWRAL
ncbi:MAG: DUF3089 domain-containing protein [Sphingomonadaceae bacterium]|nr:DUF3089 domain-containing protein [Sphingomonadaceae bacterium]